MSRVATAQGVTHAKLVRDHLRATRQGAPVAVHLAHGTILHGSRTYIGTMGFGMRLADGSRRGVKYADVDYVMSKREDELSK